MFDELKNIDVELKNAKPTGNPATDDQIELFARICQAYISLKQDKNIALNNNIITLYGQEISIDGCSPFIAYLVADVVLYKDGYLNKQYEVFFDSINGYSEALSSENLQSVLDNLSELEKYNNKNEQLKITIELLTQDVHELNHANQKARSNLNKFLQELDSSLGQEAHNLEDYSIEDVEQNIQARIFQVQEIRKFYNSHKNNFLEGEKQEIITEEEERIRELEESLEGLELNLDSYKKIVDDQDKSKQENDKKIESLYEEIIAFDKLLESERTKSEEYQKHNKELREFIGQKDKDQKSLQHEIDTFKQWLDSEIKICQKALQDNVDNTQKVEAESTTDNSLKSSHKQLSRMLQAIQCQMAALREENMALRLSNDMVSGQFDYGNNDCLDFDKFLPDPKQSTKNIQLLKDTYQKHNAANDKLEEKKLAFDSVSTDATNSDLIDSYTNDLEEINNVVDFSAVPKLDNIVDFTQQIDYEIQFIDEQANNYEEYAKLIEDAKKNTVSRDNQVSKKPSRKNKSEESNNSDNVNREFDNIVVEIKKDARSFQQFKEKYQQLSEDAKLLNVLNTTLSDESKKYQRSIGHLQRLNNRLLKEIKQSKELNTQQLSSLQNEIKKNNQNIERFKSTIQDLNKEIKDNQVRFEEKNLQNQGKISNLEALTIKLEALNRENQSKIESSKQLINELNAKNTDLENLLSAQVVINKNLDEQIQSLAEELNKSTSDNKGLSNTIDQLKTHNNQQKQTIGDMKNELQQAKKKIDQLTIYKDLYEKERENNLELFRLNNQLNHQLSRANKHLTDLQRKVKNLESYQRSVSRENKAVIQQLKEKSEQEQAKVNEMQLALKKNQQLIAENNQIKPQLKTLADKVNELENNAVLTQGTIKHYQELNQSLNAENDRLKSQVDNLSDNNYELLNEIYEKESKISDLTEKTDDLNMKLGNTLTQNKELVKENQKLKNNLSQCEGELELYKCLVESYEKELKDNNFASEKKKQFWSDEFSCQLQENIQLMSQNAELFKSRENLLMNSKQDGKTINSLNALVAEQKEQLALLKDKNTDYKRLNDIIKTQSESIKGLKNKFKEIHAENSSLSVVHKQTVAQNSTLKNSVDLLNQEVEHLKQWPEIEQKIGTLTPTLFKALKEVSFDASTIELLVAQDIAHDEPDDSNQDEKPPVEIKEYLASIKDYSWYNNVFNKIVAKYITTKLDLNQIQNLSQLINANDTSGDTSSTTLGSEGNNTDHNQINLHNDDSDENQKLKALANLIKGDDRLIAEVHERATIDCASYLSSDRQQYEYYEQYFPNGVTAWRWVLGITATLTIGGVSAAVVLGVLSAMGYFSSDAVVEPIYKAPEIKPGASFILTGISEDPDPEVNHGDLISEFLAGNVIFDNDTVTLKGIAVTDNKSGDDGAYEYSLDSGNTWAVLPSDLRDSNALYLPANAKLRFMPNENYNGTPGALLFRAIDSNYSSELSSDQLFDASQNGGEASISADTVPINIAVLEVYDQPKVTGSNLDKNYREGSGQQNIFEIAKFDAVDQNQSVLEAQVGFSGVTDKDKLVIGDCSFAFDASSQQECKLTVGDTNYQFTLAIDSVNKIYTLSHVVNEESVPASSDQFRQVFNAIQYKNSDENLETDRFVTFSLLSFKDNGKENNQSILSEAEPIKTQFTVQYVNNAPTAVNGSNQAEFLENGEPVKIFNQDLSLSSGGELSQTISTLIFRISNASEADQLSLENGVTIDLGQDKINVNFTYRDHIYSYSRSKNLGTLTLTNSGNASVEHIESLLKSLSYKNNSNHILQNYTFSIALDKVQDDGGTQNGGLNTTEPDGFTSSIFVKAVNDAPKIEINDQSHVSVDTQEPGQKIKAVTFTMSSSVIRPSPEGVLTIDNNRIDLAQAESFPPGFSVTTNGDNSKTITYEPSTPMTVQKAENIINGMQYSYVDDNDSARNVTYKDKLTVSVSEAEVTENANSSAISLGFKSGYYQWDISPEVQHSLSGSAVTVTFDRPDNLSVLDPSRCGYSKDNGDLIPFTENQLEQGRFSLSLEQDTTVKVVLELNQENTDPNSPQGSYSPNELSCFVPSGFGGTYNCHEISHGGSRQLFEIGLSNNMMSPNTVLMLASATSMGISPLALPIFGLGIWFYYKHYHRQQNHGTSYENSNTFMNIEELNNPENEVHIVD